MLVELIALRKEGVKRPKDEVRSAAPVLTDLMVGKSSDGSVNAYMTWPWFTLTQGDRTPTLHKVRIVTMRQRDFLIVGVENLAKWGEPDNLVPQAWWCRIPPGGEAARPPPPPPYAPLPIPIPRRWREHPEAEGAAHAPSAT